MKDTCYIVLVRHGESVSNKEGIIGGNSHLTELGRQQARQARELLKGFKFDEVYSSDYERAVETVEIVSGVSIKDQNKIKGLRERNMGSLEGKLNIHLEEDHKKRETLSGEENWTYRHVPDMENDIELYQRFLKNLEDIANRNLGKTILIGSHGGLIRTLLIKLEGKTYHDRPRTSFKNGGYVELKYTLKKGIELVKVV